MTEYSINHIDLKEDQSLDIYHSYGTDSEKVAVGSYTYEKSQIELYNESGDLVNSYSVEQTNDIQLTLTSESEICILETSETPEVKSGRHPSPNGVLLELDVTYGGTPLFIDRPLRLPDAYPFPQVLEIERLVSDLSLGIATLHIEEDGSLVSNYAMKLLIYKTGIPEPVKIGITTVMGLDDEGDIVYDDSGIELKVHYRIVKQ